MVILNENGWQQRSTIDRRPESVEPEATRLVTNISYNVFHWKDVELSELIFERAILQYARLRGSRVLAADVQWRIICNEIYKKCSVYKMPTASLLAYDLQSIPGSSTVGDRGKLIEARLFMWRSGEIRNEKYKCNRNALLLFTAHFIKYL